MNIIDMWGYEYEIKPYYRHISNPSRSVPDDTDSGLVCFSINDQQNICFSVMYFPLILIHPIISINMEKTERQRFGIVRSKGGGWKTIKSDEHNEDDQGKIARKNTFSNICYIMFTRSD